MKELLIRLNAAIEAGNKADEAWDKDPGNKELEREFMRAYNAEYRIREQLAAAITERANGVVDLRTALHMTYNPKLAEIVRRYEA